MNGHIVFGANNFRSPITDGFVIGLPLACRRPDFAARRRPQGVHAVRPHSAPATDGRCRRVARAGNRPPAAAGPRPARSHVVECGPRLCKGTTRTGLDSDPSRNRSPPPPPKRSRQAERIRYPSRAVPEPLGGTCGSLRGWSMSAEPTAYDYALLAGPRSEGEDHPCWHAAGEHVVDAGVDVV